MQTGNLKHRLNKKKEEIIMQKVSLNKDQQLLIDSFFKVKTKKNLTSFIEDLFSPEETLDLTDYLPFKTSAIFSR